MTLIEAGKFLKNKYDGLDEDTKLNVWCNWLITDRKNKILTGYAAATLIVGGIVIGCKLVDKVEDLVVALKHKNVVAYTEESE